MNTKKMFALPRWILFGALNGALIGLVGSAFGKGVGAATSFRMSHPWIVLGLPLAGLLIVWFYRWEKDDEKSSTNMVLDAIHAKKAIPLKTAPLIFGGTVLTHLFGGSAGREGAALQLGGSIGGFTGKLLHLDEADRRVMIMCGMSAAFSALFGTPMAAAVFSMEVVSVGIMHYAALVPCVIASYTAYGVACSFGLTGERFLLHALPEFTLLNSGKILILGVLCALVSILFCVVLHKTEEIFEKRFPNGYLRAFLAGSLVVLLSFLFGSDYLGAGMQVVERAVEGHVFWAAFLLKILFTAVTLSGGFKGGEIVPALFVGSTFGCLAGQILHIDPSLAAACGMTAVFCGVTNCPISSLLISLEMFGFAGAPFFFLSAAVSYLQSGYYGLYGSQKIVYSKDRTEFINRNVRK